MEALGVRKSSEKWDKEGGSQDSGRQFPHSHCLDGQTKGPGCFVLRPCRGQGPYICKTQGPARSGEHLTITFQGPELPAPCLW